MARLKQAIYSIILLGLYLGMTLPAHAQKTLVITSLDEPIEIRPYLEIIPDPEWQYDNDAIFSGELDHLWQAAPLEGPLVPISSSIQRLWFRLHIDNRSGESTMTWHEAYANSTVYTYALTSKPVDGPWSFSRNWSEMIAFNPEQPKTFPSARLNPIPWLSYSYPAEIEKHETLVIGLAHTAPGFPFIPNWQWQSPTATQSTLLQRTLFNVITITAITVLSFYYLVVFFRLRLMPCLWISSLGALSVVTLMTFDKSIWALDISFQAHTILRISMACSILPGMVYLGFIVSALGFLKHSAYFRLTFYLWASLILLNIVYLVFMLSPISMVLGEASSFISFFVAWSLLFLAAIKRVEGARLLILGSVLFQIGLGIYFSSFYGFYKPNIATEWALHFGMVSELICFALFLSHHTQQYQRKANIYENLFQSLYDSAQEGRFSWLLESDELQHNTALNRCLGYPESEELSLQELNQQLVLSEIVPASAALTKNGFAHEQELPLNPCAPMEDQRWINLRLSYRPANAFFAEAIEGVVQDISDRKQREQSEQRHAIMLACKLEAEQRANEAMRTATKAKDEFLSTMSHELRTPLTSIIGFTQLLRDKENLNKNNASFLDNVVSESQHLLNIVDDILQISLINEDKLILCEKNLRLCDWFKALETKCQSRVFQHNLHLQLSLDPTLPEQIRIDSEKLQQIIHQLMDNAIKFTPKGEVMVTIAKGTDQELKITITDTGIGMDTQTQQTCFNVFTQADSGHQRAFSGTGVGLYIAHSLATKLGGSLDVRSAINEGSCFTLRLPYKTLEEKESTAKSSTTINEGETHLEGNVLYVEDNPHLQALLRVLVKRTGAHIECVDDGQEALTLIEQYPKRFDLILMDLQMPVLSGFEATEQLRQNGCTTPVVAFSASALEEIQPSSLEMFDDYLGKPVDKIELKEILFRYLEPSHPTTPAAAS